MWGAQGNELSDTAPGPWVILLTITQDSPSFIAHTRRLLRVCNNYLGLAVRSLVPAQRGWCSVSLHSHLGLASRDSWWKITPLILRGGSPPLHRRPKRGLVVLGTCQSCKFISNNIKPIVAVETPRVPGLMMALWLVLKQQKLGQESFISDLFTSKSLIAIIHWWCVIGEWQKDKLQTVMPALVRSKNLEEKSGWLLEKINHKVANAQPWPMSTLLLNCKVQVFLLCQANDNSVEAKMFIKLNQVFSHSHVFDKKVWVVD